MPLLDHFRPPLSSRRHWESFHVNWAGAIADALNDDLLPEGYFAEEHARLGARVEIDVATFADGGTDGKRNGSTATLPARTWAPPTAAMVIPTAFPDEFEVLVFQSEGGTKLVAAVELVSPANQDREANRRAFAVKCANYLAQGVSLVVIDVVTSRQADLHADILRLLGHAGPTGLTGTEGLFAAAYRPIVREGAETIEIWPAALAVGSALPTLPLALDAAACLPLDLEATYTTACHRRRLG
jgi:hypothetical protein